MPVGRRARIWWGEAPCAFRVLRTDVRRPPRFSGGGRHIPPAHQETESARGYQDESEGGIHWHDLDFESDPGRAGWVSVFERTILAVIVEFGRHRLTGENDAERGAMNKKLEIIGMSCGHCVSHVKSALEGVEGVSQAHVSLENHEADVTLSDQVIDADLIAAVGGAGYQAEVR